MTKDEIAELFKKCLALHNRYQYQEEKANLRKFVETDPEDFQILLKLIIKLKNITIGKLKFFIV
ncbi:hypothetical protein RFEPED_0282 [Rickettsia felis str. Pedreira]|uniref:Uncharacterized protein n=1 Tax=Rickettsia felis str. Pedreira TaxID=1359196 RepID=A0A0F3MQH2_RICFI|nr:hypothetical protein [Rickettsia felis]KJV57911.1 hypothetical protein RFEPED_0282 [Rickettsia felis str. Pedreira]MDE8611604.1 hypothetical protein [Rickettsia felis]